MRRWLVILGVALLVAVALAVSRRSLTAAAPRELVVSAAASLADVMQELIREFEAAHPKVCVRLNPGATGALQVQIEQGAPVDIFVGAAASNVAQLAKEGLLSNSTLLCRNSMVLIVRPELAPRLGHHWSALTSPLIQRVAVGDPAYVPAGKYAMTLLQQEAMEAAVRPKCVFAAHVREAQAWVESGAADAALVYRTDAGSSHKAVILAEATSILGQPITCHIAVTRRAGRDPFAHEFMDFACSARGQAILRQHGFLPPELLP